jgi:hypothetical protein
MPDRPGRVRYTLFGLAILALILGAAAFFIAIQANGHNAQVAVNDARDAAAAARVAQARAEAADAKAEAAVSQIATVHDDLCSFLALEAGLWHAEPQEAVEAQHLYVLYRCKG